MTRYEEERDEAASVEVRAELEKAEGMELTVNPTSALAHEIEVIHRCAVTQPRDARSCVETMLRTLEEFPALAEIGTYAIPYKEHTDECKGKPWRERQSCRCPVTWVRGPSIELMVPLAAEWRNNLHGARLVPVGTETLVQGFYCDVERLNVIVRDRQVSRMKRKKNGETFWLGQDEYWREVEIQASKMHRNAIKRGIPRFVWQPIYEAALDARLRKEQAAALPTRWQAACERFSRKGVTPEDLLGFLSVDSEAELTAQDLANLGALWNASEAGLLNLREKFGVPEEPEGLPDEPPRGRAQIREEE